MRFAQAVAIDIVAVLLFAVVGRSAHAESNDLLGVARTAWPFLVGLALGTLVSRGWRAPTATATAIGVWLGTVVAGLALRVLAGATAAWPFVIVATVTLGILLVGWRLLARAVRRVRRGARPVATTFSPASRPGQPSQQPVGHGEQTGPADRL